MRTISTYIIVFLCCFYNQITAQVDKSSELYKTISKLDQELFQSYNTCDQNLEKHASFYADTIEFFHDKSGLSTSKKEIIAAIEKNVCGKVLRKLVEGSLEVYEIPNYGAIAMGLHTFTNLKEQSTSDPSRFIGFWQHSNNKWLLTKVVSLHNDNSSSK